VIILVSGAVTGGPRPTAINRPKNLPPNTPGGLAASRRKSPSCRCAPSLRRAAPSWRYGPPLQRPRYHLRPALRNGLTEAGEGGQARPLSETRNSPPGSILEARFDNTHPLASGMPERALVYFERSAAFTLEPGSPIERVAWYDSRPSPAERLSVDKSTAQGQDRHRGRAHRPRPPASSATKSPSAAKPTAPSRCCSTPFNWVR
jgi:hypothetical protein